MKGKRIETARLDVDTLVIVFEDDTSIRFNDEGQSCCERRYLTCDDDLTSFTGARFLGIEVADAPGRDGIEAHDVQFLRVKLDSGDVITCETHNEHNGYYGGFNVVARVDGQDVTASVMMEPTP